MPATPLTRRTFGAAVAAWAAGSARPATAAAPGFYQFETSVWTSSVLLDQAGQSFVLSGMQQPITVLKLWAAWCPVCTTELPQLSAMAAAIGRNVEVILVSHPQYWNADQVAARRRGLPFKLATFAPSNAGSVVEQALLDQQGVYSVPRSLVFRERDRSIVLKRQSSTEWMSAPVFNQVKALMA